MKQYVEIVDVFAREIIDSRGNPTVEAEVITEGGYVGRAAVPSGASTGIYEAVELRDGGKRYMGMGVENAVKNVNEKISDALVGVNVLNQRSIDKIMCGLDGTKTKEKLGANAILSVSLACAKAASAACGIPLYRYIGGCNASTLPVPMMNILNGGAHADNSIDIQEFMIMPIGAENFKQALRMCVEVFHNLKSLLKSDDYITSVGDEGGFAPSFSKDEEALDYIVKAINKSGFKAGEDFAIAIDAASSEWTKGNEGVYLLPKSQKHLNRIDLISYWENLCTRYPIISIEDPIGEDDAEGWRIITERLGKKIQLVGDDLFVTNRERLQKGIEAKSANSILIKLNQIGTLTETLDAAQTANRAGYTAVVSHRSGETEDTTIADIAVALNAGQIKTGAPSRSDRTSKYNRLLRIEEELDEESKYNGEEVFFNIKKM